MKDRWVYTNIKSLIYFIKYVFDNLQKTQNRATFVKLRLIATTLTQSSTKNVFFYLQV